MIQCFHFTVYFILFFSSVLAKDDDIYLYEDSANEDYDNVSNDTQEYETFEGRDEQFIGETRPSFPVNHFSPGPGQLHDLTSLLNYHNSHIGLNNKRRKFLKRKSYQYLIPLLLTAIAKVAHFLPVAKLTLLALFALVLFSKKALLVSVGSLILVLYDTFYKAKSNIGVSIVKDRGSTVPTVEHGIHHTPELHEDPPEDPWWGREEPVPPKLNPREGIGKGEKWKRWWAPQINYKRRISNSLPISSRRLNDEGLLMKDLEDMMYEI